MDEIVGDITPGEGTVDGCRILDVARHDLDPGFRAVPERLGPPGETPDVVAGGHDIPGMGSSACPTRCFSGPCTPAWDATGGGFTGRRCRGTSAPAGRSAMLAYFRADDPPADSFYFEDAARRKP